MKKVWLIAAFCLLSFLGSDFAFATYSPADLTIISLKMTGSESMVLENTTGTTLNLQNYVLQYFNKSSGINFSIPTDSLQLPNFSLAAGQSFLLSGDTAATCGAAGEANLSISLSDTNGYVNLAKVAVSGSTVAFTSQDHVSWTSAASSVGDGIDLHSVTSTSGSINSTNSIYYRLISDGSWQRAGIDTSPCNLFTSVSPVSGTTYVQWADGTAAPSAIIESIDTGSGSIPLADVGLAAPQITELLPNPAPPQSDNEDEFIELYNPNPVAFDLSGFKLQVGIATKHSYTIPNGTKIGAKSFLAFYSVDTNLAMSNSSGQAWLIDPLGNVISQSTSYASAKDGQAWALSAGKWYWTTNPTPNAANLVAAVANTSAKTKTSSTFNSNKSSTLGSSAPGQNTPPPAPVHPWTLAGVGAAALLYAGYEYRTDLANNVYRLRRYVEARRVSRK